MTNYPKPVHDLLAGLEITGVGPTANPGTLLSLGVGSPTQAGVDLSGMLDGLGRAQQLDNFRFDATNVDLSSLVVRGAVDVPPAVYLLAFTGTVAGGTFSLAIGGHATGALPHNATAATLQAALAALPDLERDSIKVAGGPGPAAYTLSFVNGPPDGLAVDGTLLTGKVPAAVVGRIGLKSLPFDVGTLAPDLVGALGSLAVDLNASLGTFAASDVRVQPDPSSPSPGIDCDVALEAVEVPPPESGRPITAPTVNTAGEGQPLAHLVPTSGGTIPDFSLSTKVAGLLGKVKGTIQHVQKLVWRVTGSIIHQTPASVTGALSHTTPATLTGTVTQAANRLGRITLPTVTRRPGAPNLAILEGRLERLPLLAEPPTPTVTWRVKDAAGADLTEGSDYLAVPSPGEGGTIPEEKPWPKSLAPLIVFLPKFVEPGLGGAPERRRISCEVRLTGPGDMSASRTIEVQFDVPTVEVPTVLALTGDPLADSRVGGFVIIGVPKASTFGSDRLEALVSKVAETENLTTALLGVLTAPRPGKSEMAPGLELPDHHPVVQNFGTQLKALSTLSAVLRTVRIPPTRHAPTRFVQADKVADLFMEGFWVWIPPPPAKWVYYDGEDNMSAAILVGPPGRRATFHVKKELWEAQGVFAVTLGPTGAVILTDFENKQLPDKAPAPEMPTDSTVRVVAGDPATSPTGSFHNALSSYHIVPL